MIDVVWRGVRRVGGGGLAAIFPHIKGWHQIGFCYVFKICVGSFLVFLYILYASKETNFIPFLLVCSTSRFLNGQGLCPLSTRFWAYLDVMGIFEAFNMLIKKSAETSASLYNVKRFTAPACLLIHRPLPLQVPRCS